jgi:hypothetical protein
MEGIFFIQVRVDGLMLRFGGDNKKLARGHALVLDMLTPQLMASMNNSRPGHQGYSLPNVCSTKLGVERASRVMRRRPPKGQMA